jgi:hypothetical protein
MDETKIEEFYWDDGTLRHRRTKFGTDHIVYEYWYEDGQMEQRYFSNNTFLCNRHGPAYEAWDKKGQRFVCEFWIDGEQLTEEEFLALPATKSASKR